MSLAKADNQPSSWVPLLCLSIRWSPDTLNIGWSPDQLKCTLCLACLRAVVLLASSVGDLTAPESTLLTLFSISVRFVPFRVL